MLTCSSNVPSTVVKKETLHSYRAIGPGVSLARTLEATLTPVSRQGPKSGPDGVESGKHGPACIRAYLKVL
jgi:hypothetical protein